MIKITSFPPSRTLAPYVHFMWIAKTTDSLAAPPVVAPPTGYVLLTLFTDHSRYHVSLSGKEFQQIPRAAFQGQHYGTVTTKSYTNETSTIGIVFKPTTPHRLWGINMNELTHRIIDAEEILGNEFTLLTDRLQQDEADPVKIQLLTDFFEEAVRNQFRKHILTENVVEFIHHKQGIVTVRELSDYFHCSSRLLERKFNEQVGVSPKYLSRVIQFNNMLFLFKYSPHLKWAELAHLAGYYDQAHLIKAFIEFTGKSPVQYEDMDMRFTQTHLVKNAEHQVVDHF